MLNSIRSSITSWLDRNGRYDPPRWYFPIFRIFGGPLGEYKGCYMTRVFLGPMFRRGRLFLHVFHREDVDRDPHDHPFDFWTLPLFQGYTESVYDPEKHCFRDVHVPRWQWSFRPATHCHRVVETDSGRWPLITLVWRSGKKRAWGFWCHSAATAVGDSYIGSRCVASRERWWIPFQRYFYGENANVEGIDVTCPGIPSSVTQGR